MMLWSRQSSTPASEEREQNLRNTAAWDGSSDAQIPELAMKAVGRPARLEQSGGSASRLLPNRFPANWFYSIPSAMERMTLDCMHMRTE